MKKYLQIVKTTWQNSLTYRLNFIMWRARSVLALLTTYFIWHALFQSNKSLTILSYQQTEMITYVLLVAVVESVVFTSRTVDMAWMINSGDFSNLLLKPVAAIRFFFSEDIADKLLNILFMVGELALFVLLFKPVLQWPVSPSTIVFFLIALALALLLYFFINFFMGTLGFWTNQVWAARFLFTLVAGILAGGLFPLDILPAAVLAVLKALPFSYLIYFPNQIFLGRLTTANLAVGFIIQILWIVIFAYLVSYVYLKGIKRYAAEGR